MNISGFMAPTPKQQLLSNLSTFLTPSRILIALGAFVAAFVIISMIKSVTSILFKIVFALIIALLALFVFYYLNPPVIMF